MTEDNRGRKESKGVALEEYVKGARVDQSVAQMAQNPPKPKSENASP